MVPLDHRPDRRKLLHDLGQRTDRPELGATSEAYVPRHLAVHSHRHVCIQHEPTRPRNARGRSAAGALGSEGSSQGQASRLLLPAQGVLGLSRSDAVSVLSGAEATRRHVRFDHGASGVPTSELEQVLPRNRGCDLRRRLDRVSHGISGHGVSGSDLCRSWHHDDHLPKAVRSRSQACDLALVHGNGQYLRRLLLRGRARTPGVPERPVRPRNDDPNRGSRNDGGRQRRRVRNRLSGVRSDGSRLHGVVQPLQRGHVRRRFADRQRSADHALPRDHGRDEALLIGRRVP